uniref:Uncharacterized protein n=1 Tax=Timema douglasi TaxID=61478 RepID=A0A7R8VCS3_TIMDO|nr:unnamed protein product [Timema douglasi]
MAYTSVAASSSDKTYDLQEMSIPKIDRMQGSRGRAAPEGHSNISGYSEAGLTSPQLSLGYVRSCLALFGAPGSRTVRTALKQPLHRVEFGRVRGVKLDVIGGTPASGGRISTAMLNCNNPCGGPCSRGRFELNTTSALANYATEAGHIIIVLRINLRIPSTASSAGLIIASCGLQDSLVVIASALLKEREMKWFIGSGLR